MPHRCVKCSTIYPDGSKELLKGCPSCGGKFFFFIKKEFLEEAESVIQDFTKEDKKEIEKDVRDIMGVDYDEDKPIVLDLESIKVLKPGQYEIDIIKLLKEKMLIYKLEDGKYIIDLNSTFKKEKSL